MALLRSIFLLLLLPLLRVLLLQGRSTAVRAGWKEPREADECLTDMEGCELAGVFLNSSDHLRRGTKKNGGGWSVEHGVSHEADREKGGRLGRKEVVVEVKGCDKDKRSKL